MRTVDEESCKGKVALPLAPIAGALYLAHAAGWLIRTRAVRAGRMQGAPRLKIVSHVAHRRNREMHLFGARVTNAG